MFVDSCCHPIICTLTYSNSWRFQLLIATVVVDTHLFVACPLEPILLVQKDRRKKCSLRDQWKVSCPPHRVFESHEAVTHPPSGSTVSADVGEGLVIVTIRSAEWNLLYGLVHNEVLREKNMDTEVRENPVWQLTQYNQVNRIVPAGRLHQITSDMVLSF